MAHARHLFGPRFLLWSLAWTLIALVALGMASAIIPNPVFGRQIPPEPFAIATWLASAPLMGLVMATYTVRSPSPSMAEVELIPVPLPSAARDGSLLGAAAGIGSFLAIGCPVCNKLALLLLGTSGAMTIYAPIQPFMGAASLALLAGTAAWRLRMRMRGDVCAVDVAAR